MVIVVPTILVTMEPTGMPVAVAVIPKIIPAAEATVNENAPKEPVAVVVASGIGGTSLIVQTPENGDERLEILTVSPAS